MEDASVSNELIVEDSEVTTPVEQQARRDRWLEVISAILLSLATVASAWCDCCQR